MRDRILVAMIFVACVTAMSTGGALAVKVRGWVYEGAQQSVYTEFRRDIEKSGHGTDYLNSPYNNYTVTVNGAVVRQGDTQLGEISAGLREKLDRSRDMYLFQRLPGRRVAIGYSAPETSGATDRYVSIYTVRELAGVQEKLHQLLWIIVLSVLGCAVIGTALGFALTRSIVRPLRGIQSAAREVADGAPDSRLPDTDIDEFQDVTTTFNDMVERQRETIRGLTEQDERAKRFVSDVAHELRSPLAALVPAAEVLDEELAGQGGHAGTAARLIGSQITDLARLVDDLLEMSQRDRGTASVLSESVDLANLTLRTLRLRGWSHRVTVLPETGVGPTINSDPRRLEAIIANLVGNALRHGHPPVTITIGSSAASSWVEVRDHGVGIPAEQADRVFERMYKVSESRTRTGGAGLGLAIARENARLLGGDVVYHREGDTTVFRCVLPR
ncbi:HAMP domain-containing protein [Nocardia brasiliensis]|uniref:histidine kinase n=2 Tax=Nocardia brasiliensis TaxID=37326 RepID=A0A6G9XMV1_NOCBR|nr:HAMP domain-containing protein [Nocardia brasiliensis]